MPDIPDQETPSNVVIISTKPHRGSAPQEATDASLKTPVAMAQEQYLAGLAGYLKVSAALVAAAATAARQEIQQEQKS